MTPRFVSTARATGSELTQRDLVLSQIAADRPVSIEVFYSDAGSVRQTRDPGWFYWSRAAATFRQTLRQLARSQQASQRPYARARG